MLEGTTLPVRGISKHFTPESARAWLDAHSEVRPDGCVIVTGYGNDGSSPMFHQKGMGRAWLHVVAFVLAYGPVPAGAVVHHACEVKACINPGHLKAVTQAENLQDSHRRRYERGDRAGNCKHPREFVDGRMVKCNPCNRDAQARWRERQRNAGSF